MLLSDLLHRQKTPKVTGITSLLFFHFLLTVILCTVSLSLSLKSYNNNTYRLIPQIIFSNSIHSHLFFNEKLHQLLVKMNLLLHFSYKIFPAIFIEGTPADFMIT